jgi:hypothetical protein
LDTRSRSEKGSLANSGAKLKIQGSRALRLPTERFRKAGFKIVGIFVGRLLQNRAKKRSIVLSPGGGNLPLTQYP